MTYGDLHVPDEDSVLVANIDVVGVCEWPVINVVCDPVAPVNTTLLAAHWAALQREILPRHHQLPLKVQLKAQPSLDVRILIGLAS
jgi:hypothetical protein